MNSRNPRATDLHGPWPSAAEELEAEYGDEWEIWRDVRPDGCHGDWIARRWATDDHQDTERGQVQAPTIERLRRILGGEK
jgi:hypothetical protein